MKQIVYVTSADSHQIHVFELNKNGTLVLLQIKEIVGRPQPMVLHPNKNILYVGIRPNFRIIAYDIDAKGLLHFANEVPLSGSPTHLSIDREGRYLFCSSYNNACLTVHSIHHNGLPSNIIQVITELTGCHAACVEYNNKIVFVSALKENRIYIFRLNKNGVLSHNSQFFIDIFAGSGPRHMVFHPNNDFLYCINELDGTINVITINQKMYENIQCIQTIKILPKKILNTPWASDIHITPDGRFLYACDRNSHIMTTFSVEKNGQQLTIQGYHYVEKQPRGFAIDNNGKYLIVAGEKSHTIAVHKIDNINGLLIPHEKYATGKGPMWITIAQLYI